MKQNNGEIPDGLEQAVTLVEMSRITSEAPLEKVADCVVVEQAVTVMVDKVGSFTIMCTPADIEALAVGFVYSEGMIDSMEDVVAVSTKEELPNVVGIQVEDPSRIAIRRNMIIASSCGMCGTRNINKMLSDMPICDQSLEVSSNMLIEVAEQLSSEQRTFHVTGGSHSAGIFTSEGTIVAFAEDIGRHSAFDKAIGKCLIAKQSIKGFGAVLSGRVSLEMVTKAARAGIELIAAVSAPSSFAIEAAKRWNITLCGFVRPGRTNVYTHPKRIHNLQTGS
ncbi:MAG: formate dehydrogenase accessory sulfurtransferase FdhD [Planctomycetota bacterium]|jgi:FdhD protein